MASAIYQLAPLDHSGSGTYLSMLLRFSPGGEEPRKILAFRFFWRFLKTISTLTALIGTLVINTSVQAEEFTIDSKNADMSNYYHDLKECKAFAEKKSVAGDAVGGAVTGALVTAAIGAAIGDNSDWATGGAKWGAIEGAAEGAWGGYEAKKSVVRNCLIGRGYKVLD